MRRFRRRRPVQWLPPPGTAFDQNGGAPPPVGQNPSPIEFVVGSNPGTPQTVAAPLVIDNPTSETFAGTSVATYQNFALNQTSQYGYKLVRIVGDIFLATRGSAAGQITAQASCLVTAGIIIRATDDDGQPAVNAQGQDVESIENNSDPWIWHRSWILAPDGPRPATGIDSALANFPATNAPYGTAFKQRVDQKTKRVVSPEHRLFLNVTIINLPINQSSALGNTTDSDVDLYCLFQYRVLGTVFASKGNRNNATR